MVGRTDYYDIHNLSGLHRKEASLRIAIIMYKRFFENKKAIFFDLDGTLADTEILWNDAFNSVLNSIGFGWLKCDLPAGNSVESRWDYMIKEGGVETSSKIKNLTEATYDVFLRTLYTSDLDVRPGFWELADDLKTDKNMKLGLVTNTDRKVADKILEHLQVWDVFDVNLAGDEVSIKKPDPEIYFKAAQKLQIKPIDILVFEDSVAGAKAADKARMDLIVIWDGLIDKKKYPKKVLEFFPDFTPLLGNLDKTFDEMAKEALGRVKNRDQSKDKNANLPQ